MRANFLFICLASPFFSIHFSCLHSVFLAPHIGERDLRLCLRSAAASLLTAEPLRCFKPSQTGAERTQYFKMLSHINQTNSIALIALFALVISSVCASWGCRSPSQRLLLVDLTSSSTPSANKMQKSEREGNRIRSEQIINISEQIVSLHGLMRALFR